MARKKKEKQRLCPACAEAQGLSGDEIEDLSDGVDARGHTLDPDEPIVCSCGVELPCTPIEMPEEELDTDDLFHVSARTRTRFKKVDNKKRKPKEER